MKYFITILTALLLFACGTHEESAGSAPLPDPGPVVEGNTGGTGGELRTNASGGTAETTGGGTACSCLDGEPGLPGEPGLDGSSCSVQQTATGALVTCDDGTTAALANGSQGERGEQGVPGPAGPASTVPGPMGPAGESIVGPAGPKGDTGAPGATGAPGSDGADGRDGVVDPSMLYVVQETAGSVVAGIHSLAAQCDDGDVVISGGCYFTSSQLGEVQGSFPAAGGGAWDDLPDLWQCTFNVGAGARPFARAVCLSVP
jgi:hypothetical protein